MLESESLLETSSGVKLFLRKWTPSGSPRAVVNIVHGMMEHSGRYAEFAEFLCNNGIEVWCADQRGHGKTANTSVNNQKEGGLLGHCADSKSFIKMLRDIDKIHGTIKKTYKNIPLVVLGHSWGSLLTQGYIEFFNRPLSGAILSGTRGPGGIDIMLGAPFLIFFTAIRGVRNRSLFLHKLIFGPYNKPFFPVRTEYDWLSRDDEAVDGYIADPLCCGLPTTGFFRDLICMLRKIHKKRHIEKIKRHLPIYILSGSKDPVGKMGASVTALVQKYSNIGINDLEYVLYPDARHECLNEINKKEVMNNILKWLEKHI